VVEFLDNNSIGWIGVAQTDERFGDTLQRGWFGKPVFSIVKRLIGTTSVDGRLNALFFVLALGHQSFDAAFGLGCLERVTNGLPKGVRFLGA
jgi:hypothetical protein